MNIARIAWPAGTGRRALRRSAGGRVRVMSPLGRSSGSVVVVMVGTSTKRARKQGV
jgi:hypothetical protein